MKTRHRAYAYITYQNKLLLFTQPQAPDSGIQVPAGTIKDGEKPEIAVLREATEETGLEDLELVTFLDQDTRDMNDCGTDELQYRWFYHIRCNKKPPVTWTHGEFSETGELLIPFDFFWSDIDNLPKLVANYDDKIPLLKDSLSI